MSAAGYARPAWPRRTRCLARRHASAARQVSIRCGEVPRAKARPVTHAIRKVLVLGGGLGGLAAATALSRSGVRVDLAEIRPAFAASGVGIGQPANGLRSLRAIGVLDESLKAGLQFDRLVFRDNAGGLIGEHRFLMGAAGGLPAMNALPRSDLHRILLDAARRAGAQIRMGVTAEDVSPAGDGTVVLAPHLTRGASMALEDAVVLAEELVRDAPVPERMERCAQRRFRRCEFIQRFSHRMLLAEQGIGTADELRLVKDNVFPGLDRELADADRAMDIAVLAAA